MTITESVQLSVVTGFRNWGTRRLKLVIENIAPALDGLSHEVISSDFGSGDPVTNPAACKYAGARYVYTEDRGPWSRSHALNIGFAHCRGDVIIYTDADMLFSPGSLTRVHSILAEHPQVTALLECRDLPATVTEESVEQDGPAWESFEGISRLRGRWGMGGMVAVGRKVLERIRGLDERCIHMGARIWTSASGHSQPAIDSCGSRTLKSGCTTCGTPRPTVPSSSVRSWKPPSTRIDRFSTMIRNLTSWRGQAYALRPLVTVAIATRNRSDLLKETLLSIMAQTVTDFEIVIVDDGGEDDSTKKMVANIDDPRIRYIWQTRAGIAAARNRITAESRGYYIAIIDDDDLMPSTRLEQQARSITSGVGLVYGSFVNFETDGNLKLFSEQDIDYSTALQRGGAPGHFTWFVDNRILEAFPYDESVPSGEDNELFLRLIRNGVIVAHSGTVCATRRLHSSQVTRTHDLYHKAQASRNFAFLRFGIGVDSRCALDERARVKGWVEVLRGKPVFEAYGECLPDALVRRRLVIRQDRTAFSEVLLDGEVLDSGIEFKAPHAQDWTAMSFVNHASAADLARLRQSDVDFDVIQHWPASEQAPEQPMTNQVLASRFASEPMHRTAELAATADPCMMLEVVPSFSASVQVRTHGSPERSTTMTAPVNSLPEAFAAALRLSSLGASDVAVRRIADARTALAALKSLVRSSR